MRILILYAGSISRISGTSERIFQIAYELAKQGVQVTLSGAIRHNMKTLNLPNLQVVAIPNRIVKLSRVLVWVAQLVSARSCNSTSTHAII